MKFGYYFAKADRLDGNCVRLAGHAMLVWHRSIASGFSNPSDEDCARIAERPDGSLLKQLVIRNFFSERAEIYVRNVECDVESDTNDFECDES